jgi:hypothetical protein
VDIRYNEGVGIAFEGDREKRGAGMKLHANGLLAGLVAGVALAATAPARAADDGTRMGMPWDWSHRHMIYGNPDSADEAIAKGTYSQWQKHYRDPRFVLQLVKKMDRIEAARGVETPPRAVAKATRVGTPLPPAPTPVWPRKPAAVPLHRDWSFPMGGGSGVGGIGMFPAKYSFDITATPSCADDFVVYATNSAGANPSGSAAYASRTGSVTGAPGAGTITITNGSFSLVLTRSTTQNTGLFFINSGTNTQRAAAIAAAIARNGDSIGVTATSSGSTVTVTAINAGTAGNSITLADAVTNFSWAGGSLTGGGGTPGQPTIFAVNNLYSTCQTTTEAAPEVFWAYNTGTGAVVETSPILSLDGTQVAFIQRTGSVASLVLLKWSSASPATQGAPTVPTSVTRANYRACTAPCMTVITLSGSPNNTRSSPYYQYFQDDLWVGDADGVLHKFTGVFLGTPAESGSPWPVTVAAGVDLSSPVYDGDTDLVFVGSARDNNVGGGTGGRLHTVNNATGAVISSGQLSGTPAATFSTGIAEAPLVDSLAQRVYAFAASGVGSNCASVECQSIYQFDTTSSIAGLTSPRVEVGRGQINTRVMYAGVFDNAYYTSNPASPTGFMYVCGSIGPPFASSRRPTLWRIPITANVMGTPVLGPTLVSTDTADNVNGCSPITDVQNGSSNRIYVAVPSSGSETNCTGACIYMYTLNGISWSTSTAATDGLAAPGGTGGIIIDNISGATGASQVYYSTRTSPGRAIQASQAGLN